MGVRYVILDMSRVSELDSTGARILLQAHERLKAAKCVMVMCGTDRRAELSALIIDHGIAEALTPERMFDDLDHALERCEDHLLETCRENVTGVEHVYDQLDLVRDLDDNDRAALRDALVRREYSASHVVFRQGEDGDALYVIARGSASVWLRSLSRRERSSARWRSSTASSAPPPSSPTSPSCATSSIGRASTGSRARTRRSGSPSSPTSAAS